MGLGNRVRQTVVSAPGRNLSVNLGTVVVGFTGLHNHYSDETVEYWIEDIPTGGVINFEHGRGFFDFTDNTLSRDTLLETLENGSYSDSPVQPIDASANAHILVAPSIERINEKLALAGGTLEGHLNLITYSEFGDRVTLVPSNGVVTVRLDGRRYEWIADQDVLLAVSNIGALPRNNHAVVDIIQDATGGRVVSFPAGWAWHNGAVIPVDLTPNVRTRLILTTPPDGSVVDVDSSPRFVV